MRLRACTQQVIVLPAQHAQPMTEDTSSWGCISACNRCLHPAWPLGKGMMPSNSGSPLCARQDLGGRLWGAAAVDIRCRPFPWALTVTQLRRLMSSRDHGLSTCNLDKEACMT